MDSASGKLIPGYGQEFPWAWLISAVSWNAAVLGVVLVADLPPPGIEPQVAYAVAGLLAAAGAVLVYVLFTALRRHRRFRHVRLLFDPCPAILGEVLRGAITLPVPDCPANACRVRGALRKYTVSRVVQAGNVFYGHRVLIEREASVRSAPSAGGTRLDLILPLPAEAPASDFDLAEFPPNVVTEQSFHRWHLHLVALGAGVFLFLYGAGDWQPRLGNPVPRRRASSRASTSRSCARSRTATRRGCARCAPGSSRSATR
jgi:hypothetical protein